MLAKGLTPILNVSDIGASFAWFEKLGWQKAWDWGDPPTFGAVCSGRYEIFLCQECQGSAGTWMSLWVDDVDAVYTECQANGIEVTMPPTDEPWNVREMHVRHPDGHMFRIGKGLEED